MIVVLYRRLSILTIGVASILSAGCTTTAARERANQCDTPPSSGWVLLATEPQEASQLFALIVNGDSVQAQLDEGAPGRSAAWFRSEDGMLRYCRYTPGADPCRVTPDTVDFVPSDAGTWSTKGVMNTICISAEGRGR